MGYAIEVRGLSFKYDEKTILDNISFNIDKGSFVSIIGPNGSGKTTLLRNISSVLSPTEGSVLINGRDIKKYKKRELAKNIAFVPQNTVTEFEFSVMDVVLMGRAPYLGPFQSETQRDIDIALDSMRMTNVLGLKDKKITEISGGERQRVIISCALAQASQIILLDEPVSNLDIQHQVEILGILRKLKNENNMTVVTVLHDLNLASEYSDVIMLVKDGRLMESGPPSSVINRENIKRAYSTDIFMTQNPVSGKPHIIPLPSMDI